MASPQITKKARRTKSSYLSTLPNKKSEFSQTQPKLEPIPEKAHKRWDIRGSKKSVKPVV